MDFFKIDGTTESSFYIDKRDKKIVSVVGRLETRNSSDDLIPLSVGEPINPEDAVTLLGLHTGHPIYPITAQSNGLPTPTSSRYILVTTTGGGATAGDLYWDDGTTVTEITKYNSMLMFVLTALTGGTIEVDAESFYYWSTGDSLWHKKTGDADLGGTVKVDVLLVDKDSTWESPANAIATKVTVNVTTPYDNGATIAVNIGSIVAGWADLSIDDTYTVFLNEALVTGTKVETTIANSPTVGSCTVLVEYTVPKS